MNPATPERASSGAAWGRRIAVVGVLALALAGNLFLAHQALRLHRARTLLMLDPPPVSRFEGENRSLGLPAAGRVRLVYFGDSRIAEWAHLPEPGVAESINRGYPGDTTALALLRLREDVLALGPRVVVLQIGINDLKAIAVLPDRAADILRSARRNVTNLVGVLRGRGIEVVVLTVWPRGPVDLKRLLFWGARVDRAIREFNSHLETLEGDGVFVVDCDSILSLRGRIDPRYSRDMLHLNAAGYERLGAHLTRHLDTLVARLAVRLPARSMSPPVAGARQ
jgi:lysophospholipase L1-like esterase